jgi:hypothetical protein
MAEHVTQMRSVLETEDVVHPVCLPALVAWLGFTPLFDMKGTDGPREAVDGSGCSLSRDDAHLYPFWSPPSQSGRSLQADAEALDLQLQQGVAQDAGLDAADLEFLPVGECGHVRAARHWADLRDGVDIGERPPG